VKALDMVRADRLRAAIDDALPLLRYIEAAARGCRAPACGEQERMPFRPADLSDDAWTDLAELVEVLESAAKDDDFVCACQPRRDVDAAGVQLALASVELDHARHSGEVRP